MAARAPGPPTCCHSSTCSRHEGGGCRVSVVVGSQWCAAAGLGRTHCGSSPLPPLLTGWSTSSSQTVPQGLCPPCCCQASICSAQPRRPPPARPLRKRAREQTDRGQCGECQIGGSEVPPSQTRLTYSSVMCPSVQRTPQSPLEHLHPEPNSEGGG
jgi:hypothetical protein